MIEKMDKKTSNTKAIFWDLQGTLGGEATEDIERFAPYSFAREALQTAKENGFLNIIITNQSLIGKGLIARDVFIREANRIIDYFNEQGQLIDDFLYCPHKEEDNCDCKKPKTGLIQYCAERYCLIISECYVIGDIGKNEIVMAKRAGCKGILVMTGGGKGSLGEYRYTWNAYEADFIANDALEAVKIVTRIACGS